MTSCMSRPISSMSRSLSSRPFSIPVMRVRRSASCSALSALTLSVAKCASGTFDKSRCGCAIAAAAGTPTCEWISMVVDFGRPSRPGLPCLRAAVGAYRLVSVTFLLSLLEHPQMLRDHALVRLRLGRRSGKHDRAGIHDHDVIGKVERELDVLLDEHDGKPLGFELRDGAANLVDDLRRESFGRLVH